MQPREPSLIVYEQVDLVARSAAISFNTLETYRGGKAAYACNSALHTDLHEIRFETHPCFHSKSQHEKGPGSYYLDLNVCDWNKAIDFATHA